MGCAGCYVLIWFDYLDLVVTLVGFWVYGFCVQAILLDALLVHWLVFGCWVCGCD